ncbi:GNAT family N-acetyltransferase [Anaerolineales bacterium]
MTLFDPGRAIIRFANSSDIPALIEFLQPFIDEGELLPRTFAELEMLLNTFFIALVDDTIVGCAALEIYSPKLAEIRSLAVAPHTQGSGIGKKLVQACVDLGAERGVYEIMAISASDKFFHACGFDYTLPNLRRAFFMQTRDTL